MTTNPVSRQASGLALAAGGAALFSLKGVLMKLAFIEGATVEQMMAIRMGLSLPVFLAIGLVALRARPRPPTRGQVALSVGLGVLSYYVCTWLDFSGLQYISAQFERLVLFLYPTVTAVLAWIFLGDRLTWRHGAALALSYGGVAILAGWEFGALGPHEALGSNVALGAGLVFAAAVLFACYVTAAKGIIGQLGSRLFTSIAMAAAAVAILLHFGASVALDGMPPFSSRIVLIGIVLAVGCTVAPAFMITESIARIGPGLSSAVGGFGPAATAGVAVVVLGEPFGLPQAAALVLTVAGILLLARAKPHPGAAQGVPHVNGKPADREKPASDRRIGAPEPLKAPEPTIGKPAA